MALKDRNKKTRSRPAREIFKRSERRCQRCRRKIKMGRYCFYCGRYRGLW